VTQSTDQKAELPNLAVVDQGAALRTPWVGACEKDGADQDTQAGCTPGHAGSG